MKDKKKVNVATVWLGVRETSVVGRSQVIQIGLAHQFKTICLVTYPWLTLHDLCGLI